ncbi:CARDB domain-containing protein [Halolamina sp. C58]|uniref:CARDB domain-containing protein n=1 Tax=Halolamina sp. C58 TaxID=3421640 RepID=UPI003EB6D15D
MRPSCHRHWPPRSTRSQRCATRATAEPILSVSTIWSLRNWVNKAGEQLADETTTPPKITAVNPGAAVPETLAAGSTKQVEITVRNIGDATASDVTVSLSPPSFLAVSPENAQIGTLMNDAEATSTFTVEGIEAGSGTLEVVIETADQNGGTTAVEVTATAETKDVIDALTGTDGEVSFAELLTTIEYYNSGEAVPNTGGEQVTLQHVLIIIERYNNNE